MNEDGLKSVGKWVSLVGGISGLISLFLHFIKWLANRKRRGRQDALGIDNLEKLKKKEMDDYADKQEELAVEFHEKKRALDIRKSESGVSECGRHQQLLAELKEQRKRRINALTREHEKKMRDIGEAIEAIKNRPID